MWAMAQSSMVLFFRGKLFADPGKVSMQLAIGVLATAIVMIALTALERSTRAEDAVQGDERITRYDIATREDLLFSHMVSPLPPL